MTKRSRFESLDRSDLRASFEAGLKPSTSWGVGLEYERFGLVTSSPGPASRGGIPLPIDGPVSVSAILEGLIDRFGWTPLRQEGRLLELSRGPSRITLEPGGQMELSGAVHRTIHNAAEELRRYVHEVRAVSEPMGVRWLGVGTHPTAEVEEIPWLPKKRYELMKQYLPSKGRLAHQMMKGTCGAQVNFDFADEADAMEKLKVAMGLSAIVAAAFANSPITAGKANGFVTQRSAVWLQTDPDRSGLLPFAFSPSACFDNYIDWALSVPMIFLVRDERWVPMNGLTFSEFLERGWEGNSPTLEDWSLHLSTLFPDVRLKSYIEVRGTDSGPPDLVLAHAALWKGVLYGGPDVLAAAYAPVAGLTWEGRLTLRRDIARLGLRAEAGGRPLLEIARTLLDLARAGLTAAGAAADASYLDPLRELIVVRGITPAEDLLARFNSSPAGNLPAVLDQVARLDPFA